MLSFINKIESIRKEKEELDKREAEIMKPLLTDFTRLPGIYQLFCDITAKDPFPARPESIIQRKKFIMIAIYLYSPSTLLGEKMLSGLRQALTETLQLRTSTTISNACSDLVFYYWQYHQFRNDVNRIYKEMQKKLRLKKK